MSLFRIGTADRATTKLAARVDQILAEVAALAAKLNPEPPEPPRVTEPEHVYALAKGSVLEDPATDQLWLVTEVVNPPNSGSHDPICLRLDANTAVMRAASDLLPAGPDGKPITHLRVLRSGIGPDPAPAPQHRPITYPQGFRRPT